MTQGVLPFKYEEEKTVSVYRVLHLLRWREFKVHEYVCMPAALHLQHPVNAYHL